MEKVKTVSPDDLIRQLEHNAAVVEALFTGVPDPLITWKPSPERWSILEVLCHLADEEVEDFRTRVRLALFTPTVAPPEIDPEGWVLERQYAQQDFEKMMKRFLFERSESTAWLRSLTGVNWSSAYEHPRYGPMSARFFLENWLAHDYLHMRQLVKLKYDYLSSDGANIIYAGTW